MALEHSSSFGCSLHIHGDNLGICCVDFWSLLHKVVSIEKVTCHLETGLALSEACLACLCLHKTSKHTHSVCGQSLRSSYMTHTTVHTCLVASMSIKIRKKGIILQLLNFFCKTKLEQQQAFQAGCTILNSVFSQALQTNWCKTVRKAKTYCNTRTPARNWGCLVAFLFKYFPFPFFKPPFPILGRPVHYFLGKS